MKMRISLAIFLGAYTCYGISVDQTIRTSSGPVRGHAASVKQTVSSYLGIPYAKAPVGPLRFMPPVPYVSDKIINGSKIGFACPSVPFFSARGNDLNNYNTSFANLTAQGIATISAYEQIGVTFGEDCLTLNVWVPAGGEVDKAVMIYIYGGRYTGGSTQIPFYDGQHLAAAQDIIVVTLNYRVGILGFPGAPGLTNRNPGFLDQRLAVEWVRDNIAAFGGNASRMTLFGQSAGSAAIDHYGYSYAFDPIVSGFIMESGAAGFGDPLPADHFEGWNNVSATLNCGTTETNSSSEMLSCLQNKDIKSILAAIGSNYFDPTVDGITGFPDYAALSREGKFAQIPILIGNNDFEAGTYIPEYALMNISESRTYWENHDNLTFACPAGARANISVSHALPTWRYRWFGDFPNARIITDPDHDAYAYHCGEIPFIWDTLPTGPGIGPDTGEEVAIRAYVQGAWAAFAKNPRSGLSTYEGGWPQYSPHEPTLIRLAYDNKTGTNLARPETYDSTCHTTYPIDLEYTEPGGNVEL